MSILTPARADLAAHPDHAPAVASTHIRTRDLLRRWRRRLGAGERGSSQVFLVLTVITLIVVVGLVVDGAGKVQATTHAQHVAASAARAATNAVSGDTVGGGALAVDPALAQQVALDHLAESGMTGTVTVSGATITVTVAHSVETRFLGLIGIGSLAVTGEATASLIDGPAGP